MSTPNKSHWYYFTYKCGSSDGTQLGCDNFGFSTRIEGDNFELSMQLYSDYVSKKLLKSTSRLSGILITSIFYIGHFEKMIEPK